MKYIASLLLIAGCASAAYAQENRWMIGVNAKAGAFNHEATQKDMAAGYTNNVNAATGTITYTADKAMGGDLQVGYFFTEKSHFGIGLGLLYMRQTAEMSLDAFRIEYQEYNNNETYRQMVTMKGPVKEEITMTNINLPVMLKYRTKFSKVIGLTVDAGVLINLEASNKYTVSGAAFDYEAVYRFQKVEGNYTTVYDGAATPDANDWYMTADRYKKDNPNGNTSAYFDGLQAQGYNVGLNQTPTFTTGVRSYKPASLGFIVQPSITFAVSKVVSINVGGYFMYQTFKQSDDKMPYRITDRVGSYRSIVGLQTDIKQMNYGGNLGLGFHF